MNVAGSGPLRTPSDPLVSNGWDESDLRSADSYRPSVRASLLGRPFLLGGRRVGRLGPYRLGLPSSRPATAVGFNVACPQATSSGSLA